METRIPRALGQRAFRLQGHSAPLRSGWQGQGGLISYNPDACGWSLELSRPRTREGADSSLDQASVGSLEWQMGTSAVGHLGRQVQRTGDPVT